MKTRITILLAATALATLAGCGQAPLVVGPRAPVAAAAEAPQARAPDVRAAGAPTTTTTATHRSLTLDGAKAAIAGAVAYAKSKHTTGVIAIVDAGGNLMAVERIDDTFAAGAMISIGKARTAVLFKKPTRVFEEIIKNGRTPMIAVHDFTPLTGGIPIVVGGEVIGGIGVSGAASAPQDEELAIAGAQAVERAMGEPPHPEPTATTTTTEAAPADPIFIPSDKVAAAFLKGTPLIELPNANIKVHASRREGAGKAEVHTHDADVIYVLPGTATLVTGGSVVDPKPIEAEEIRGASITGGQTQRLAKGDVLIVPKGLPHWFKEASTPFTYYVVKVRS